MSIRETLENPVIEELEADEEERMEVDNSYAEFTANSKRLLQLLREIDE